MSAVIVCCMAISLFAIAVPAQAAHTAPDNLSVFMPNGDYGDKNQLSDQFDGQDNLAHLTAVASVDTDNVTFFACPAGQVPFNDAGTSVSRNAGCDVVGTDSAGQSPGEFDEHGEATSDEAYEVFWNIPADLDGETVDIFALACQGAEGTSDTDPNDGTPDNCIQDEELGVYLEDSSDEDDLISGEIVGICTATGSNVTDTTPNAGDTGNRCFNEDDGDSIALEDRPFREDLAIHGGIVPDDGFTLRFTTSADVATAGACLAYPNDAETDPLNPCNVEEAATLEQEFTTYKQWIVTFDDVDVPEDDPLTTTVNEAELDLAIYGTPEAGGTVSVAECDNAPAGFTADALDCVFDEHYVISTERQAEDFVLTFDADDDFNYEDDCDSPTTEASNQLDDEHAMYACFTDQFGDPFPAAGDTTEVTFESAGPEGSEISSCPGTSHDHDSDNRSEHCHVDEGDGYTDDGDFVFEIEVDNYSTGTTTATPGDQVITACQDDEAFSGTEAAPGTNHGCQTAELTATATKHWQTAPDQTRLVFSDGADAPGDCLTGDQFRENNIGDTDNLLVCTFDSDGNFTGTEPAGSGRLQWFISPSGGGELTATRFDPNPPNETGADGTAVATIESFRQGNDVIQVCLQNDPGGNANTGDGDDCSSVQKRVTGEGGGGTNPACSDGVDNDGDGQVDGNDPGCSGPNDTTEGDGGTGGGEKIRVATNLTIRYDAEANAFKGAAGSSRKRCQRGRLVRVKKIVPGPNRTIGRDRTNKFGNWRVDKRRVNGRYYAVVTKKKFTLPSGDILVCQRDRSVIIKLKP